LDNIDFIKSESGSLCVSINGLSDDLHALIRENLSLICHGNAKVTRNTTLYSYRNTLAHFLERYDRKCDNTKKGIIGELLTHVLLPHFQNNFQSVSVHFNLEENSIKKGFDLVLRDAGDSSLWFVEVKSGECGEISSGQKLGKLLSIAKNDLMENLNSDRNTLWQNAINGASIALPHGKLKNQIEVLLEECNMKAIKGGSKSSDFNAVLVAACYSGNQTFATDQEFEKKHSAHKILNEFQALISVAIQKDTHDSIAEFLREESSG